MFSFFRYFFSQIFFHFLFSLFLKHWVWLFGFYVFFRWLLFPYFSFIILSLVWYRKRGLFDFLYSAAIHTVIHLYTYYTTHILAVFSLQELTDCLGVWFPVIPSLAYLHIHIYIYEHAVYI